jgi:uracil-DNA glycosylase
MPDVIKLDKSWLKYLGSEFEQDYMLKLKQFLIDERRSNKLIYPKGELIFNAFNTTPLDKVKVVILGQDPYHGPLQAHGLSFSVPPGTAIPPSLKNIYKEIERDLAIKMPKQGCLQAWAEQGVLLLNATLTVEHTKAGSHQKKGWETFTDQTIKVVNDQCQHVVFLLWGNYAQKKGQFIDANKHYVLSSPHPSPLSAHRGFLGNNHFSLANAYLQANSKDPIDWQLVV